MTRALELLKKRYITDLKKNPKLYVGVELEFPIVNLSGAKTAISVCQDLLRYLAGQDDFVIEKLDTLDNPIQLLHVPSGDRILFEVSYTSIEFAFDKAEVIQDVEERFLHYLDLIQAFLKPYNHAIKGEGIHPYWFKNKDITVQTPRYQMLMSYLALSRKLSNDRLHDFPEYGGFICGNQVQLDVSRSNYLRVINAFNAVESVKAYLFANSEFSGVDWDTLIARDLFWENSMHGLVPENVGIPSREFVNEQDFLSYLSETVIFNAERDDELVYFFPIKVKDYLETADILAYRLDGSQVIIQPMPVDFNTHRSYHYQDLTTRGTVEFRSVCTQPLSETFAPIAFHLGLLENLDELEALIADSDIMRTYHRDFKQMRRLFSRKHLSPDEKQLIASFSEKVLFCALKGLQKRDKGEEYYLNPVFARLDKIHR